MSFLTGSAPQAQFSTQSTIDQTQGNWLTNLLGILGTPAFGGPSQIPGVQPTPQASQALSQAISGISAAGSYPTPTIDPSVSSAAFQKGVVDPLTTDFMAQTLPSVVGHFGGSAGGAYGSGGEQARQQAQRSLEEVLAGTGAQYTLGAERANQQADLTAQGLRLGALTGTPAVTSAQQQQQGQVPFMDWATLLNMLLAGATAGTQQTSAVGTGGSSGLLQGLLTGGVGTGIGTALGNLLSRPGAAAGPIVGSFF